MALSNNLVMDLFINYLYLLLQFFNTAFDEGIIIHRLSHSYKTPGVVTP